MPGDEPTRVREVYRAYRDDPQFAARWSAQNRGNQAILEERRVAMVTLLGAAGFLPLAGREVLDLGCGRGETLASLRELGAHDAALHGVDILPERIQEGREQFPDLDLRVGTAEALPYEDRSIDLVLAFTLFSSILDPIIRAHVSSEIDRALSPSGAVLLYDMRYPNPRNPNVRPLTRNQLRALLPGFAGQSVRLTVLPPLARRLGRLTPRLYRPLSAVPFLCSHRMALLRRN